jgi:hypothetical protein
MEAVGAILGAPTEAEFSRVIGRIRRIPDWYRQSRPDLYGSRRADIERSTRAVEAAYRGTVFPHMRVWPGSDEKSGPYPNWRTHVGCTRCHGVLQRVGRSREELPAGCDFCHRDVDPAKLLAAEPGG